MRTFIVRLQEGQGGSDRTGTAAPRLRGVVDDVATGSRATFRNDQELVIALLTALGADPAGPSWRGNDRSPLVPLSGEPNPHSEEK